jgi:hypothetical protein
MQNENLVGYLLKALDPADEHRTEEYLQSHPEAQVQVDLLRQAMEPLEADREDPAPPPTLRVRTLARLAEYRNSEPLHLPPAPAVRDDSPRRSWWSRADLMVAASILLLALPFVPPGIHQMQVRHAQVLCMENLHKFQQAFVSYADKHHGRLPMVEDQPPRDFAGVFVPTLHDEGVLDPATSIACPSNGNVPVERVPTLVDLQELFRNNRQEYQDRIRHVAGCYAYALGYRDANGRLHGVCQEDSDRLPIMADRPAFDQCSGSCPVRGNSKNHGDQGQNVLYKGGFVQFATKRTVGINDDDIYLNRNNRAAAGVDPVDTCLGASWFKPSPDD